MKGLLSIAAVVVMSVGSAYAQSPGREMQAVEAAAEALGGKERLMSLRTLVIEGHGKVAYNANASGPSASVDDPERAINTNAVRWTLDLQNDRSRMQRRRAWDFTFAYSRNMTGQLRDNLALDSTIAYNVAVDGAAVRQSDATARARRMEMQGHPIVAVRTALEPGSRLSNYREEADVVLVDMETSEGERLTLEFDSTTRRPRAIRWIGVLNNVLGDVAYRTSFTGYQEWSGLQLPSAYNTRIDFRDVSTHYLFVDRNYMDTQIDNIAAPESVRSATAPNQTLVATAEVVSPGVWLIRGNGGANSILMEFADHLTVYEVPSSNAWTKAILATARATVPGKPLTQAIVSHNHFDHAGGLRQAVAEGLSIITYRENIKLFAQLVTRPARVYPDDLARNPRQAIFVPVDDHLELKDAQTEVHVYRILRNSHMANAVMAYVPRHKLLIQADIFDAGWDLMWWGNSYRDSISARNLAVERDVPVHGGVLPIAEVLKKNNEYVENVKVLCEKVERDGYYLQGCPGTYVPGLPNPTNIGAE